MTYSGEIVKGGDSGAQSLSLSSNTSVSFSLSVFVSDAYTSADPKTRLQLSYTTDTNATPITVPLTGEFQRWNYDVTGQVQLVGNETTIAFTIKNLGALPVEVISFAANAVGSAASAVTIGAGLSKNAAGKIFGGTFNAKTYGAIGSGSTNPASGSYSSLAALQAVYPFATALTNEMDWLGIQSAINAAKAAGGGAVYVPVAVGSPTLHPTYVLSNASSAGDGSGTLTLPEVIPFYPPGNGQGAVNLIGDGQDMTVLRWPSDLGSGKLGMVDANRQTTISGNTGTVSGITLQGPATNYTIGTKPANMSGYGIGSGKHLQDFGAVGFNVGVDFVGGQSKWHRVRLENNYYNVYWSAPNGGLFGDTLFDRCIFQNAMMACVGVAHTASVIESVFNKCTFDASPWAFFKETNAGTPTTPITLTGCTFIGTQFEAMGNGAIGDDQLIATNSPINSVNTIYNTHFKDTYYSWSSTYKNATYGAFCIIGCADGNLCEFDGLANWTPGSAGIFGFHNGAADGVTVRGDIEGIIAACNAATGAAKNLMTAAGLFYSMRIINTSGHWWEGNTGYCSGTASAGQMMNLGVSQFGQITYTGPTNGNTADTPGGVCRQVGGGDGTSFTCIIVADRGFITGKSSGTFSTNFNVTQWLRAGAAGAVIPATSSTDTATSPIVGMLAAVPGTTTPVSVYMRLKV